MPLLKSSHTYISCLTSKNIDMGYYRKNRVVCRIERDGQFQIFQRLSHEIALR